MDNSCLNRIKTIGIGILVVSLFASCTNRTIPPEVYYTAPTEQAPDEIKDLLLESSIEDKDGVEPFVSESAEEELFIPDEYYEIIDTIVLFADNFYLGDENPYWDSEYVGSYYELCDYENAKDLIGFAFLDIDEDNIAELAILDCSNDYQKYMIFDLYAYRDGDVKRVFSGGYRCAYYLTKDLVFYNIGSSGAEYSSISKCTYDAETQDLSFIEGYWTIPNRDVGIEGDGGVLCYTTDESYTFMDGLDSPDVEVVEYFDLSSSINDYSFKEEDLYDFGDVTTLTEYCETN
jgi:hypothetical protein